MAAEAGLGEQLLDALPYAVLVVDRDWRWVSANVAARSRLGDAARPVDDVRARLAAALGEDVAAAGDRVLGGGPEEVVRERCRLVPVSEGVAVLVDERLPEPGAGLHRQLADEASAGLGLRDLDSRFTFINAFGAALMGLTPEDVVGRTVHDLFPDAVADLFRAADLLAQRTGTTGEHPSWGEHHPEHGLQLLTRVFAVHDADGAVVGTGTAMNDVTRLGRAEASLAASEKRHTDVFATTSLGQLLCRADGSVLQANTALCRMLGWSRAALRCMTLADLVAGDGVAYAVKRELLLEQGPLGYEVEESLLRSDGREVPVLATVNLLGDPDGEDGLISVLVRDRSLVTQLQAQLVQAERRQAAGQLAAGVAHDANNVLAAVSGYAQLLAAEVVGMRDAERHVRGIRRSVDRATEMVERLLASTRGEHLATTPVDLGEVVEDLAEMLGHLLPPEVALHVTGGPAPTWADPTQVGQVLVNLVVNARSALAGTGTVRVESALQRLDHDDVLRAGWYAVVCVTDDGPGMSAGVAAHCFDPFFSTRPDTGGTGLGLSSALDAARAARGDLRVTTAPGAGACFRLLLPADASRLPATRPPATAGLAGRLVLVAEQDDHLRTFLVDVLQGAGCRVVQAHEPFTALSDGLVPDLLVTHVAGRHGPGLPERLQAQHSGVPVLFLCDRSGAGGQTSALAVPCAPQDLLAAAATRLTGAGG